MIITKLQGGLGNQMFQYALGRHLAHIHNAELKLDISWFDNMEDNTTPREYKLKTLNIIENIAANDEIKRLKKYEQKNGWKYIFHNFLFADNSIYIKEKQSSFDKNILKAYDNIYLDGFWQSEKYFSAKGGSPPKDGQAASGGKSIESIIRKEFIFKNPPSEQNKKIAKEISAINSVSAHIRRGDYINSSQHGLYGKEYYKKAEKIIKKKIKDPCFFVFSDDTEWAKKNIIFNSKTSYITNNKGVNDYEDMRLMSMCKHNIIVNSSFSWWGAWLNQNPNKIVIAPREWVKKERGKTNDRHCAGWIII